MEDGEEEEEEEEGELVSREAIDEDDEDEDEDEDEEGKIFFGISQCLRFRVTTKISSSEFSLSVPYCTEPPFFSLSLNTTA